MNFSAKPALFQYFFGDFFVVILFDWFVLVLLIGLLCKGQVMNLFLMVLLPW